MANEVRIKVSVDDAQAKRALTGVQQTAETTGRSISGAFATIQRNWLAATAAIGAAYGATQVIRGMVSAASDLEESTNKVRVVFGESSDAILDWSRNSARAFGQSRQQALEAAGTFGNLFTAMGLTQTASAGMSKSLIELTADLASFNNVGTEEVLIALRAGLVGEVEPMRRLGVQINVAAVEAQALKMGLERVNGELTEAQKVQARYALILEQTTNAQGDFERTSGGLANQQRILAAELDNLQAQLGTALLPVATAVVSTLANMTSGMLAALDAAGGLAAGVGGAFATIGSAAENAARSVGGLFGALRGLFGMGGDEVAAPTGMTEAQRQAWLERMSNPASGLSVFGGIPGFNLTIPGIAPGTTRGGGLPYVPSNAGVIGTTSPEELFALDQASREASRAVWEAWTEAAAKTAGAARSTEDSTTRIVEAYLRGGDAAVAAVRAEQARLDEAWVAVSEGLRGLGIDMPEAYRSTWEAMLDEQKKAAERLLEEEKKLAADRLAEIQKLRADASRQAFDVTRQLIGMGVDVSDAVRLGREAASMQTIADLNERMRQGGLSPGEALARAQGLYGPTEIKVSIGNREFTDAVVEANRRAGQEGR